MPESFSTQPDQNPEGSSEKKQALEALDALTQEEQGGQENNSEEADNERPESALIEHEPEISVGDPVVWENDGVMRYGGDVVKVEGIMTDPNGDTYIKVDQADAYEPAEHFRPPPAQNTESQTPENIDTPETQEVVKEAEDIINDTGMDWGFSRFIEKIKEKKEQIVEKTNEYLDAMSLEEREAVALNTHNIGHKVEAWKADGLAKVYKGFSHAFGAENNENSTMTRWLSSLGENVTRKREVAHDALLEDKKQQENADDQNLWENIKAQAKDKWKLAKDGLKLYGATVSPRRWVMWGGKLAETGAAAGKETRFKNKELIGQTQYENAEAAAEEAWAIYDQAQKKSGGDVEVTKAMLDQAYIESIPQSLLDRLESDEEEADTLTDIEAAHEEANEMLEHAKVSGGKIETADLERSFQKLFGDPKPGDGSAFVEKMMQSLLQKQVKRFAKKANDAFFEIDMNENLTSEEKAAKKEAFLSKWGRLQSLKDYDRMMTQQGAVDTLAMTARNSEVAGRRAVNAMMADSFLRIIGQGGITEAMTKAKNYMSETVQSAAASINDMDFQFVNSAEASDLDTQVYQNPAAIDTSEVAGDSTAQKQAATGDSTNQGNLTKEQEEALRYSGESASDDTTDTDQESAGSDTTDSTAADTSQDTLNVGNDSTESPSTDAMGAAAVDDTVSNDSLDQAENPENADASDEAGKESENDESAKTTASASVNTEDNVGWREQQEAEAAQKRQELEDRYNRNQGDNQSGKERQAYEKKKAAIGKEAQTRQTYFPHQESGESQTAESNTQETRNQDVNADKNNQQDVNMTGETNSDSETAADAQIEGLENSDEITDTITDDDYVSQSVQQLAEKLSGQDVTIDGHEFSIQDGQLQAAFMHEQSQIDLPDGKTLPLSELDLVHEGDALVLHATENGELYFQFHPESGQVPGGIEELYDAQKSDSAVSEWVKREMNINTNEASSSDATSAENGESATGGTSSTTGSTAKPIDDLENIDAASASENSLSQKPISDTGTPAAEPSASTESLTDANDPLNWSAEQAEQAGRLFSEEIAQSPYTMPENLTSFVENNPGYQYAPADMEEALGDMISGSRGNVAGYSALVDNLDTLVAEKPEVARAMKTSLDYHFNLEPSLKKNENLASLNEYLSDALDGAEKSESEMSAPGSNTPEASNLPEPPEPPKAADEPVETDENANKDAEFGPENEPSVDNSDPRVLENPTRNELASIIDKNNDLNNYPAKLIMKVATTIDAPEIDLSSAEFEELTNALPYEDGSLISSIERLKDKGEMAKLENLSTILEYHSNDIDLPDSQQKVNFENVSVSKFEIDTLNNYVEKNLNEAAEKLRQDAERMAQEAESESAASGESDTSVKERLKNTKRKVNNASDRIDDARDIKNKIQRQIEKLSGD